MSDIFRDLQEIFVTSRKDLGFVVDQSVLITGGTGFVGTWLTNSWLYAADQLGGKGRLIVTSRSASNARPALEQFRSVDRVEFVDSDIRSLQLKPLGRIDLVVHTATPARLSVTTGAPREMFDIIVEGQKRLLSQLQYLAKPRVVFTSSGAVYGPQSPTLRAVSEDQFFGFDSSDPSAVYHEGKRAAEMMLTLEGMAGSVDAVIARLFAFVGPLLPLNEHFAIGNFIRDALNGTPIVVQGDGSAVRSYQYPTDLISWLWAMAARPLKSNVYNVGSDHPYSIREIAEVVASLTNTTEIQIRGVKDPLRPENRYVPSIDRAKAELRITNKIELEEAVRRTIGWHRNQMT